MGQKFSSDARAPALGRHGDIENLHIVLDDHAARKTNELAVVMSHPPTTRHGGALAQLREELGCVHGVWAAPAKQDASRQMPPPRPPHPWA